jgi:hypothetical protein
MMTTLKNATTYIFVLAAITIIGIVVLVALGKTVPSELTYLATGLVGGGLGISVPSVSVTTTAPAAPAVVYPAPAPVTPPAAA